MIKKLRTNIHASAEVDESFEELEQLAAVAGSEDSEDLDAEDDVSYEDDEDADVGDDDVTDEDDGEIEDEEEFGDDEEVDAEDDSEDEDSEYEEVDSEDEEEFGDDVDEEVDAEDDTDSEDEYEEVDSEDECEDDEDAEYEDVDASEDEVDEDEVLASLAEAGLLVVISTTEQISEQAMGLAIASLEDEEYGDDVDVDVEASEDDEEYGDDVDVEVDASEEEGDAEYEVSDDEDGESEDDSEDDVIDEDETEDSDEEETDDEDGDYSDDEDGESEDDSEYEGDADTDEEIDEDRLAPVASREMLAHASHDDVSLVLHNSKSNPVWNVIVAGVPAARLALSSYGDGAEEVRSFFTTQAFADGVKHAMASEGVLGLLDKSNAEYYANAFKESELFAEARAQAEKIGNQKVTAATAGLREDFVDAMKIAAAGMDKNFFQKPNHLKRELFIALSNVGVQNPQAVIEEVFANASADYFETLAETAEEFLDMPSEAREVLRNNIENSGTINRGGQSQEQQPVQAATASSALDLIRGMQATASAGAQNGSLSGSHSERKHVIRNLLS